MSTDTSSVIVGDGFAVGYRHGWQGIKHHLPPNASERYTAQYCKGWALGVLLWCWVMGNTLKDFQAATLEPLGRTGETCLDTCMRLAGVVVDWRGLDDAARGPAIRAACERDSEYQQVNR